jgi:Lrp/AsnC family transcriptional regulator, leucine-responsive regulatory protein
MPNIELDALDRRILAKLQEDNLIPADRLGELVGLSASAVQRRTRRLREAGVIIADVSIVDPKAVGLGSMFIVEVMLDRESVELVETFKRRMRAVPEVQQCYYITGEADFLLIVTAANVEEYEKIIERLFLNETSVRKFRTGVVLNRVKTSLAVPVMNES